MSSGVARKGTKGKYQLLTLPNELLLEVADRLKRFRDLHALLRTCRFFKALFHTPLYRWAVTANDTVRDDIARWVLTKYRIAPLRYLLDNGLSANHKFSNGSDLLYTLCGIRKMKHPVPSMVRLLLERGADIGAKDATTSNTVLHQVVRKGHQESLALLLTHGADAKEANMYGVTPLHRAASLGVCHSATLLLEYGADVNAACVHGFTPLHEALRSLRPGIVPLLLARGADVNTADRIRNTPLHCAVVRGDCGTATLLLAHGADVDARNNYGETPLLIALDSQNPNVIPALLAHGADAGAHNNQGTTSLHVVSQYFNHFHRDFAKLLVENGADVNAIDFNGHTPLQVYIQSWNQEIFMAQFLLENGADVNVMSRNGYTLLVEVMVNIYWSPIEKSRLVKLLIAHGAV